MLRVLRRQRLVDLHLDLLSFPDSSPGRESFALDYAPGTPTSAVRNASRPSLSRGVKTQVSQITKEIETADGLSLRPRSTNCSFPGSSKRYRVDRCRTAKYG